MEDSTKTHAVLLSSPGLGHLIPVMELGKRLQTLNFKVTIFVVPSGTSAAESQVIESFTSLNLSEVIVLPTPDVSHIVDPDDTVVTRIGVLMHETRPAFSSAISALSSPPTVLIVDLFGIGNLEVADEFKIPKFVYIPSHAWFLALTLHLPILHESVTGEYVDEKNALFIPGCKPLMPEDVVDPMLCRSDKQYFDYLSLAIDIRMADGIFLNTWEELEPATLAALHDHKLWRDIGNCKVPIFPVGPLVRTTTGPIDPNKTELFHWLENQPIESVLYVSFGSGGVVSNEQLIELAYGLELSQQRFIWVVRPSAEKKSHDGSFFTTGNSSNANEGLASYLPEGFLDRTKNMGFIVSDWAPQVEILRHESVGGFLSHCGWNSSLESIMNGVPLIAWPLYSEQKMTAALLEEDLKVALRPRTFPWKGIVGRDEIQLMVEILMVGEEGRAMRGRVKELKSSGERAWNHKGSSANALAQFMC